MRWQTAVALASGHPVLATALFEALTLIHPFKKFGSGALRLACAHAAWIAIALGVHAPQLWQCSAISALFSASLCSESLLSAAIRAMHRWDDPAFPKEYVVSDSMRFACRCDGFIRWAAQAYGLKLLFPAPG